MLTYIIIFIVIALVVGAFLSFMNDPDAEQKYRSEDPEDDLSEEEIEYDYLQRMEEEQEEEDEYLSRH